MKRRQKKKSRRGKVFLLVILAGVGAFLFLLLRQEIFDAFKVRPGKRSIPEERREVLLYFGDPESEYMIPEKRAIPKRGGVKGEAEEVIKELIKGSKRKLISTLPQGTKLLALHLDEKGVARVNFDKALSKGHPGGSSAEIMTVYSVVNSLTLNFPEIKQVQFLVEGKEIDTIAGHLSMKRPISSRPDLIKR